MADRYSATVGKSFTLDTKFTSVDGTPSDVDISKVEIQDFFFNVVKTVVEVEHLDTGHYRAVIPPLAESGTFYDVWYYRPNSASSLVTSSLDVVVRAPEIEEGDVKPKAVPVAEVCHIHTRLVDASGMPVKGILAVFSPDIGVASRVSSGFAAYSVSATSDAEGYLSLHLMKGMTGLLTIVGIGIVRHVTIPDDSDEMELFDLVSGADDPLHIQNLDNFIELPRRSI